MRTYNRLTILSLGPPDKHQQAHCLCSCGTKKWIYLHHVTSGHTKSCGCYNKEVSGKRFYKDGCYHEVEHMVWRNMIRRCTTKKFARWYSDRKVCDRWLNSYQDFLKDVGRRPGSKLSLDRIDNDKGYEPGNVRWTTQTIQSQNTKNHETNKTGFRGVSWSKNKEKYRVHISVNNKSVHLGYFDDFEDACEARRKAQKKLWAPHS